jgi:hypothetical protein
VGDLWGRARLEAITRPTHTAKQQAIEAIEQLPDNVALDEIVYRLYVLKQVHQGLDYVGAGRVVSSEALAAEIEQW